jgi:hypothetical protein
MSAFPAQKCGHCRACSASSRNTADTLGEMSLFDATAVTPPGPCSRCGKAVGVTSVFCPDCGQSTISPLPAPPEKVSLNEPEPAVVSASEPAGAASDAPLRTTGWLRRSLNLGKKPLIEEELAGASSPFAGEVEPTREMSLFDIHDAENVAIEKPRRASAAPRYVLKFDGGVTVTVGTTPGVVGVKPASDEVDDTVHRIVVEDTTATVAAEHLEFGVKNGVFWVKDLKTVAGTVVEEPGSPALQCIPYDLYSIVRGTRVVMGEMGFSLH